MDSTSTTVIYDELVAEKGDVLNDVRTTAETIRHELESVLSRIAHSGRASWFGKPGSPPRT